MVTDMCANYEPIAKNRIHLLDLFEPTFDYKADIFPNYSSPLLFAKAGNIEWRLARFGLVAPWVKDIKQVKNTYNARTETIASKPSFKNAWKKNQFCLIPVDTIFEPKYIDGKAHWYGIYRTDGIAKKNVQFNGVCNLVNMDLCDKEALFSAIDVSEVWGVGRKHSKRLQGMGINTVLDLACSNPQEMKELFSIVIARTVSELQGVSCIEIEHTPPSKKQIVASRSFGSKITDLNDLKEAISMYAQDACSRLRGEELLCGTILAFVQSNPFDTNEPFYNKSISYTFTEPTDSAPDLTKAATAMLNHIYKAGINYKKCGVLLTCLEPKSGHTYDLLTDFETIEKKERLMKALEGVHEKYGKKKIGVGACYIPNRNWAMSRDKLSPNPFRWDELISI